MKNSADLGGMAPRMQDNMGYFVSTKKNQSKFNTK